jgi:hypothetical protein
MPNFDLGRMVTDDMQSLADFNGDYIPITFGDLNGDLRS